MHMPVVLVCKYTSPFQQMSAPFLSQGRIRTIKGKPGTGKETHQQCQLKVGGGRQIVASLSRITTASLAGHLVLLTLGISHQRMALRIPFMLHG